MIGRRYALRCVLATLGALVALAWPGRAQAGPTTDPQPPKPGALIITVCDADNHPVKLARVEVRHRDRTVAVGTTNAEGKIVVPRLHPGKYAVAAAKRDVGRGVEPAQVVSMAKTEVKVQLKK